MPRWRKEEEEIICFPSCHREARGKKGETASCCTEGNSHATLPPLPHLSPQKRSLPRRHRHLRRRPSPPCLPAGRGRRLLLLLLSLFSSTGKIMLVCVIGCHPLPLIILLLLLLLHQARAAAAAGVRKGDVRMGMGNSFGRVRQENKKLKKREEGKAKTTKKKKIDT